MNSRDERSDSGRLDLSAVSPSAAETDRVVSTAMARLSPRPGSPRRSPVFEALGLSRPLRWAAAAAVVLGAISLALAQWRTEGATSVDLVSEWAAQRHVPTNAELLVAFQGYGGSQR